MNYEDILSEMRLTYREEAGYDADDASDIGIRLKVVAAEVAALYEQLDALRQEVFPQTSTGESLSLHAETRGLSRKPAIMSQGVLRFSRETPALTDIPIPVGLLCSTKPDPQVHFETTSAATLKMGETSVDVEAQALDAGAVGNVAAKSVSVMISPATGISSVSNPDAFTGGVDEESDDELRARLLEAYQNISNGTNCAFYYDLAMSHEGVSSANVLPRQRGRGTVDVVVACRDESLQDAIVAEIAAELAERKEINVDVLVTAASTDTTAVSAELAVRDGYNLAIVSAKAQEAVTKFLNELGVGESLLLATLGAHLLAVDGVYNYRIISPGKDVVPTSSHVLRPGTVTISGMAVG